MRNNSISVEFIIHLGFLEKCSFVGRLCTIRISTHNRAGLYFGPHFLWLSRRVAIDAVLQLSYGVLLLVGFEPSRNSTVNRLKQKPSLWALANGRPLYWHKENLGGLIEFHRTCQINGLRFGCLRFVQLDRQNGRLHSLKKWK